MLKPDEMVKKDKGMLNTNNKYTVKKDQGINVKNPEMKYNISGKFIKIIK